MKVASSQVPDEITRQEGFYLLCWAYCGIFQLNGGLKPQFLITSWPPRTAHELSNLRVAAMSEQVFQLKYLSSQFVSTIIFQGISDINECAPFQV